MNTDWCVFKEISMEIGMINFLNYIIGHCTDQRNLLYQMTSTIFFSNPRSLKQPGLIIETLEQVDELVG